MYLQELIGGKDEVIQAALRNPGVAPRRNPTIELVLKAVAGEVEYRAKRRVADDILPTLRDAYEMYTLMNGEFEDTETPDEYGSGLDDEIEKLFEPYEHFLSADWLARNTIDTRLWEENAIAKLAESAGKEVFKQLSYNKTPNQVLSSAGIVQNDVELYFEGHMNQTQEQQKEMSETTIQDVAQRIKLHVGDEYDRMEVYGDLELACDDDEILAHAALARLGLEQSDYDAVQMAVLEHGDDTVDTLAQLVEEAPSAKAKANADKPKREPAKPSEPKGDQVDPRVLGLLKEHSAAKDTEMSERLGVSRATYNNWINGKNPFQPTDAQRSELRDRIVSDTNGLLEALAILDGTQQMAVE